MVVKLKLFRIFANKDISYIIGQEDELHDSYDGFFSKDDPEETMINSL